MKQTKKALIEVRNSFLKQYSLAKKMNDIYYMEFFSRQIKEIDKKLKEKTQIN